VPFGIGGANMMNHPELITSEMQRQKRNRYFTLLSFLGSVNIIQMMQLDPSSERDPVIAGTIEMTTCCAKVKSDSSCGEDIV
jgi:hypothetical protein